MVDYIKGIKGEVQWCRTNRHGLPRLSRGPKIIAQGKYALVEVGIPWNWPSWSETAFWTIVFVVPKGTL